MNSMNVDLIRANRTRTILAFSVPAIISMVLTSLINVADGFFMGNFIHKDAIAAVNLGLPIIYLFLATGLMVSVGGSVLAGMSMGRKDEERCRSVFSQTIATCAASCVLLSVVMFFLLRTVLAVLGAEGKVAEYFLQYYTILLFELPVMTVNASLGMFVRAEGRPQFYMAVTAFTCVLNILLDWLFTAGFGFGVRGIAAASLVSALLGFAFLLFYFLKKARVFRFVRFRFDRKVFRDTMLNGLSEFIGELSMCISIAAYNFVIMKRIGVDGVYGRWLHNLCFQHGCVRIRSGNGSSCKLCLRRKGKTSGTEPFYADSSSCACGRMRDSRASRIRLITLQQNFCGRRGGSADDKKRNPDFHVELHSLRTKRNRLVLLHVNRQGERVGGDFKRTRTCDSSCGNLCSSGNSWHERSVARLTRN